MGSDVNPMQTKWKVTIVTVVVGVLAFMVAPNAPAGGWWESAWPFAEPVDAEPVGAQVGMLMLYGLISALAFGLAVAFLIFGWKPTKAAAPSMPAAMGMYIAIAWILGNWYVHDNLHMINGHNFWGLIVLEYVFHVTLIAAAAFLALQFYRMVTQPAAATARA
jgi:hypothetical protein